MSTKTPNATYARGVSSEQVERLLDRLRARGERVTGTRRQVLDVLAGADRHLTAEEIVERVPAAHRATIYRTLELLERADVIEHNHLGHGAAVFHLAPEVHQHLVCDRCGAVIDAPPALFAGVSRTLRRDLGFVMRPIHFALNGVCRECADAD